MKSFILYLNLIPEIAVITVTFLFALDSKYENDNELFLGFASFLSSVLFFNLLFLCIFPHNEGICPSENNFCECDCDHKDEDCDNCDINCNNNNNSDNEAFFIIIIIILVLLHFLFYLNYLKLLVRKEE